MEKFDHLFIQPRDWTKSFQFFTETLGWKVKMQHGEQADASRLAFLASAGEFNLVLAEDHDMTEPSKKPATYTTTGKISMHFTCDDTDAAFAKIKDGAHVKVRPENNHWGTRWFLVEDPDGNQFAWNGPVK